MDKTMAEVLSAPFPPELIGKLPRVICRDCSDAPSKVCGQHKKTNCAVCGSYITERHIHLDYVGHADVTNRLVSADPNWTWEPLAFDDHGLPLMDLDDKGNPVGMWIRLTVGGTSRLGYGSCPPRQSDAVKVLIGDCLLAGTPIQTSRGTIPIEDVRVGDLVPTSDGWRRVTDHWMSHPAAPTRAVLLADGRFLVGTPHHRIPTSHGVKRIDSLRNGDTLSSWQDTEDFPTPRKSNGEVDGTDATPHIPTGIVACTTWRRPRRATTSIETSTRQPTARSRPAGTSTMSITTQTTTALRTSSHSVLPPMHQPTEATLLGTNVPAMNVAAPTSPSDGGLAGALLLARNVGDAETGSPTFHLAREEWSSPENVPSAASSTSLINRGRFTAPVGVVAVLDGGVGEVWNLSVDGTHEYVANGILVHNSLRNAAMRFGVATDLWAKGDRSDPSVENATEAPGNPRSRQPKAEVEADPLKVARVNVLKAAAAAGHGSDPAVIGTLFESSVGFPITDAQATVEILDGFAEKLRQDYAAEQAQT